MHPSIEIAPYLPFDIASLNQEQWEDTASAEYTIGKTQVKISLGNIMQPKGAQAIVIPSALTSFKPRGVAGHFYRSKAQGTFLSAAENVSVNQYQLADLGITLFEKDPNIIALNQPNYLFTAMTVSANPREQFQIVTLATSNALSLATLLPTEDYNAGKVTKIAFPALATGVAGALTADQSARAMLQAIHEFNNPDGLQVGIIILDDPMNQPMLSHFKQVATEKTYLNNNLTGEMGKKQICTNELLDHINLENLRNELYDSEKAYRVAYSP